MKGLSTILSTVILLALVITIYAIVSTYSTSLVKEQGAATANRTGEAVRCSFSNIDINAVYIDRIEHKARIHIRNAGQTDESIDAVIIYNKEGDTLSAQGVPLLLLRNDIKSVELNITDFIQTCDQFDRAIVTTTCADAEYDKEPAC